MQSVIITHQNKYYPPQLQKHLTHDALRELSVAGNLDILVARETPWIALFCSRKYPGSLILPALDAIRCLRDSGRIVVGGFHSSMEQECLRLLLRGTQPVVVCPARAIQNMRLPDEWRKPLEEKRLLILSSFAVNQQRMTAAFARQRNEFVALLADEVLVIHAELGGNTFDIVSQTLNAGKKVYTVNDPANLHLLRLGVQLLP